MKESEISKSFLIYATEILGNTDNGISTINILKYCNAYSVQFSVDIPISSLDDKFDNKGNKKFNNKREILYKNLENFSAKQQFFIISELCEISDIKKNPEVLEVKKKLYERYSNLLPHKASDELLIMKTENNLKNYSKVYDIYIKAIENFEQNKENRHILDDMRLSLELLLKEILNNDKSMENQFSEIGKILKERGISDEIRNLFVKILDYYSKYQNNNVKHDSQINEMEVKYIIEQTSIFINFIIDIFEVNKEIIL